MGLGDSGVGVLLCELRSMHLQFASVHICCLGVGIALQSVELSPDANT